MIYFVYILLLKLDLLREDFVLLDRTLLLYLTGVDVEVHLLWYLGKCIGLLEDLL